MQDFNVVLGCFGLKIDEFTSCNSIENIILKVNTSLYRYNDLMDYFDQCRLFDKPLLELNAIRHFIFNINSKFDQNIKPLWLPKKFELYQKFVIDHRHCGLYVKLSLPEEDMTAKSSEAPNKLRLVRQQKR